MAFIPTDFFPSSAQANGHSMHSYSTAADDLATVKGSGYFDVASATSGGWGLKDNDFILVTANDGVSFLQMAVDSSGVASVISANDFA